MKASIVVGLGFGDEGKGLVTDWLCSPQKMMGSNPLVIRYSGGQQCGHTVVIDGKSHIHANFGSGTLRGIPSYFSEHCSFYMNTLVREHQHFVKHGVKPELYIHPLAIMTTPMDVAFGRIREKDHGHGSCGLGIGTTQMRHNSTHKLYAVDLLNIDILKQKMVSISQYYLRQFEYLGSYIAHNDYQEIIEEEMPNFIDACKNWKDYINYLTKLEDLLDSQNHLIFEGSQGILLDKDHGIFPNVTYANTTSKNALEIIKRLGLKFPHIYYVTRCYQTRHGNGWMSNRDEIKLINNENETCVENTWQGKFRTGELDYQLLNYAMEVDSAYHPQHIIKSMVVTCMDQRPGFVFDQKAVDEPLKYFYSHGPEAKNIQ
jgi:adenylosuccinate synthase